MTNLDIHPGEVVCRADPCRDVEVIEPRNVPLGGIRSMTVRRTLPARGRPFIGSWCFVDHYGPDHVADTGGMTVPPHPHCGLATVSWLFRGEIEHRDSLGTRELVLPGELNLMTAGRGIAHSEVSTRATTTLHGVQLWLALPPWQRDSDASFLHYAPEEHVDAGAHWRVFLGEVAGEASPVRTHSSTMGAEVTLSPGATIEVALNTDFEHGVLVDSGRLEVDGNPVAVGNLVALPVDTRRLRLRAGESGARALLIGGTPMESGLVMWWNFIGGSHEEIVAARQAWQVEIGAETPDGATITEYDAARGEAAGRPTIRPGAGSRFGTVLGYDGAPLPAPRMPGGRLKPRGAR
ncbi:MAG: pirin family protein [Nakamurella sp.]